MKTKIIATIGPSSLDFRIMKEMAAAGMSIARINTKYGSRKQYLGIKANIDRLYGVELLYDVKFLEVLDWLKDQEFDYLALSFAESAEQIHKIREFFEPQNIKIVAKIESQKGIENIDEIIEESDGVMVARGDLGKNISYEKVPISQKIIIKKCNTAGKMVITATEMLLSMTHSAMPERAEASDIANAVLDGSNFLMLSEETATGEHPILTIKTMAKIITETEKERKLLG